MLTTIDFLFDIGICKEASPCLGLWCDGHMIQEPRYFAQGINQVSVQVHIPCQLQWRITDRGPNDTEIDGQGHIMANRYACLKHICIDGICIDAYRLNNTKDFQYTDQHDQVQSCVFFWDKNGQVTWNIPHDDPVIWWLDHRELWSHQT